MNNYRIDIFNKNKKLAKQVSVSGDINSALVKNLAVGDYYLVAYADNNGIYEKIAAAENFSIKETNEAQRQKFFLNIGGLIKNPFFYIAIFGFLIIVAAVILKILNKNKAKNG